MEGFTQDPVGFFGMYDMGVGGYDIVASTSSRILEKPMLKLKN